MKICTLTIPFFSDAIPQPASLSPPLITASALFPTSHLSSLHHQKEVKILHKKPRSPWLTSFPPLLHPIFLASLILTFCLISLSFHSCPPPPPHTLPHHHHISFATIFPPHIPWTNHLSSLLLPITLSYYFFSLYPVAFSQVQPPLSLSVSIMKDKDL